MSVRTIITITKTAREALERYEAAEECILALPIPGILATESEWTAWRAARAPYERERAEAAELLASFVSLAMRMALNDQKKVA